MKTLISIGSDRSLFEQNSSVSKRLLEQSRYFKEIHVIVFSLKKNNHKTIKLAQNITIYPTNSVSKLFYIHDAFKIAKRNRGYGKSIVTCQDPFESGLVGLKLKRKFKIPLQIQIHTDFLSKYFGNSFLNKLRVLIARKTLPEADGIRVVSKRIKDSIVDKYAISTDKIDVLPVFIDVSKFMDSNVKSDLHKKYPQFKKIILMASRLTSEKNISFALDVFKDVSKNNLEVGLLIVGKGPELKKLQEKVGRLSLQSRVVFENWSNDLFSYYKTADLFLSASLYEGFGLTLIEASLCGCPVITSDVGIVSDILQADQDVLVCPVNDKDCFVSKISGFLSNQIAYKDMVSSANKKSWENIYKDVSEYTQKYVSLIDKIK